MWVIWCIQDILCIYKSLASYESMMHRSELHHMSHIINVLANSRPLKVEHYRHKEFIPKHLVHQWCDICWSTSNHFTFHASIWFPSFFFIKKRCLGHLAIRQGASFCKHMNCRYCQWSTIMIGDTRSSLK